MAERTLNEEVQLFVRDVQKSIPMVDNMYQLQMRMSDESFKIVRFNTAEKAAIFLAATVVLTSADVVNVYA